MGINYWEAKTIQILMEMFLLFLFNLGFCLAYFLMIFLMGRDSISSTQQAINMQMWSRLFSSESGMTLIGLFKVTLFFKIVVFKVLFTLVTMRKDWFSKGLCTLIISKLLESQNFPAVSFLWLLKGIWLMLLSLLWVNP